MHSLGLVDKLGVLLSLSLCNRANFDLLYLSNISIFIKFEYEEQSMTHWLFPGVNFLEMHVSHIFVILENKSCHKILAN